MRLAKNKWRLVTVREIVKDGKSFNFMKFANTETFETNDFMAGRDLDVKQYPAGLDYDVTLDVDGKFMNVVGLEKVTAAKAS